MWVRRNVSYMWNLHSWHETDIYLTYIGLILWTMSRCMLSVTACPICELAMAFYFSGMLYTMMAWLAIKISVSKSYWMIFTNISNYVLVKNIQSWSLTPLPLHRSMNNCYYPAAILHINSMDLCGWGAMWTTCEILRVIEKQTTPYLHRLGTVNHVKMYIQCHCMSKMGGRDAVLLPSAALYHGGLVTNKGQCFKVALNDIHQH